MAHDEIFDLVNEAGEVVGQALRSECHGNPALMHPVVHVLVHNRQGDLFLQKRALNKDIQPGRWDTSVGGHLLPGETVLDGARREMQEELGVADADLEQAYCYVWRTEIETERVTTFVTCHEGPFELQASEIDEGRFWTADEIEQVLGAGVLTPNFEHEFRTFCRRF
jgi:isopentenyldiphosphate isomerase